MLTLGQSRNRLLKKRKFANYDIGELNDIINEAQELLNTLTKPKDSLERVGLTAYGGILTLPRQYLTCEGALRSKLPLNIRNAWFEVIASGQGSTLNSDDVPLSGEVVDMGDGYCCFREPGDINAAGCQLKVYTDATGGSEVDESIIEFYGTDSAGNPIRTNLTSAPRDGEALDLLNSPGYATTSNSFFRLTQVVKPITNGILRVYAINPSDVSENLIALYWPGETEPNYRRYKVPLAPDGTNAYTVTTLLRKRYIEAIQDNDPLCLDHFGALLYGVLHVIYRDANDGERAALNLGIARDLLSAQAVRSKPASSYPPPIINMDEITSGSSWPGY